MSIKLIKLQIKNKKLFTLQSIIKFKNLIRTFKFKYLKNGFWNENLKFANTKKTCKDVLCVKSNYK